jgi:hypothetical protein
MKRHPTPGQQSGAHFGVSRAKGYSIESAAISA